jgi:glycosyltransferase involved in cell wall biosynthesis
VSSRSIRVTHLVWRLSPSGGIQRVVRELAAMLPTDRVLTSIVSVRPIMPEDRVHEVVPPDRIASGGHRFGARRARLALALPAVTAAMRRQRPDVIHLHSGTSWIGLPAALSLRSAVRVLEMHDAPQSGRSRALNQATMRWAARHGGFHLIAHSRAVGDQTAKAFGLQDSAIGLVPLGIDTSEFSPDANRGQRWKQSHDIAEDREVVAWVGRVDDLKRPHDALEIARHLATSRPRAMMLIAGSGPLVRELRERSQDQPNVRVLGFVEDLAGLLNAADVLLSTSAYEGFGLAIAEALACGVPAVSTDTDGTRDVVIDGVTGVLRPIGDTDALAGAISELLQDDRRRQAMSTAAALHAKQHLDRATMIERYTTLYESLTGK